MAHIRCGTLHPYSTCIPGFCRPLIRCSLSFPVRPRRRSSAGQLGDGLTSDNFTPQVLAFPFNGYKWIQVSCSGSDFTAAIDISGKLYTWGRDWGGNLGLGGAGSSYVPANVAGSYPPFEHVSTGDSNTCARTNTGDVYCTGTDMVMNNAVGGQTWTLKPIPGLSARVYVRRVMRTNDRSLPPLRVDICTDTFRFALYVCILPSTPC
jgi:hypothetical protein